ncbi:MAG: cobyric acid synthase [Lachnospiraceae bacterium]|nr:cobyric acid synthase [Lachnospiraceae bacterium]
MAKIIMVQGTMSNAGKSLLVAGLCRIFKQDGYRVAPFKSQNMALNSYITAEGLEMGRAQVIQAEAAGIEPKVCMNPILLKPTDHTGSQVIVGGEVIGNMSAKDYFSYKKELIPYIKEAFNELEKSADIIVIEGAGSPAEINLKENDLVNMGLACMLDAPVLLVGDIDRGGVFAQLLGTLMLLEDDERDRVKGLVINKFRGDKSILDPGITMLEEKGKVPVTGVIPYMDLSIEDEDSLTERFDHKERGVIDIAVIRYPRISNFTDFNVFELMSEVSVRYVTSISELGHPDIIILPGSKNTMGDLKWMRSNGLETAVKKMSSRVPVIGICGGYQMLGCEISDPDGVEAGGKLRGMELLPVTTILQKEKTRRQVQGSLPVLEGALNCISGCEYKGYEIHMGVTEYCVADASGSKADELNEDVTRTAPLGIDAGVRQTYFEALPVICSDGINVYGSYVHGIFDEGDIADRIVRAVASAKGVTVEEGQHLSYRSFKEKEYDKLADILRLHLNMEEVYGMLREARVE